LENNKTGKQIFIKKNYLKYLINFSFSKIIVNSLVTSFNYDSFLSFCKNYKAKFDTEIIYLIHDYHCICPRINLLANNVFCNLDCKNNNCKFSIFVENTNNSIDKWRKNWSSFMGITDTIYCFSESSKKLINRTYPELNQNKIIVKPHDMGYCSFKPIKIKEKLPLNIAIVGACFSIPKGKLVIQSLFKNVSKEVSFSMIGVSKKQLKTERSNVIFYGKYEHSDLPQILEKSGASCVVFPSVWPETFSYLVSELILLDVPIICFNLGAQAEKVKTYSKGIVCEDVNDMINLINSKSKYYGK